MVQRTLDYSFRRPQTTDRVHFPSWRDGHFIEIVQAKLVATSTNHSEIIALYEASREYVWLRMMINHIEQSCGIGSMNTPIIIYEDNAACVTQMQTGYIKRNMTKYIAPKLFFPRELQQSGHINVKQIKSCDNLADLFTKSLPTSSFGKCVRGISM